MKIQVLHCGYIKIAKYLLNNGGRFSTDIAKAMLTPDRDIDLPKHLAMLYHPFVPHGMTIREQLDRQHRSIKDGREHGSAAET